jgi:branched-chain amino acid transport system ATP-binding protein
MSNSGRENEAAVLLMKECTVKFGGLTAVDSLSFQVNEGEILALIGPNGAGKTTVFNMITGIYTPTSGDILFGGRNINALAPHQVSRLGVSRTFQNIRLFKNLSVLENVLLGLNRKARHHAIGTFLRTPGFLRRETELVERARGWLRWMGLTAVENHCSMDLPYGLQRRLEMARALATEPRLLLLDEPAAGMNPHEKADLADLIQRLRDEFKLSIIVIEHDMKVVMKICPRIVVLDHGQKICEGNPEKVQCDESVIEAYLGEKPKH